MLRFHGQILVLLSCAWYVTGAVSEETLPSDFFPSGLDAPPDFSFDAFPYFPEFFRLSTTPSPSPFRYERPARPRLPRPASSRAKASKAGSTGESAKEKARRLSKPSPSSSSRSSYPTIFRFTSDRVNLADFDSKKKTNDNYLTLSKGDELDSDQVKRSKFLILHGGVFEIEQSGRSSGKVAPDAFYALASETRASTPDPPDQYLYKT